MNEILFSRVVSSFRTQVLSLVIIPFIPLAGFFTFGTLTCGTRRFFVVGESCALWKLSSAPGLLPLDASSTRPQL